MKLAAVTGMWLTGLAVVVAAVALVSLTTAKSGRSSQDPGILAGAQGKESAQPRTIQPAQPAQTSVVYRHTGSAFTTPFQVGGAGDWQVRWSYSCPAGTAAGFSMRQSAARPGGISVTRDGRAGHGLARVSGQPGRKTLQIQTACRWRVAVTRYR
jgi:hypothetical protein